MNGVTYGNAISKSFTTQGEVIQRIMSIATTFTGIFNTAAADDRGTVVIDDWCYFRITNLDDTNFITLDVTAAGTGFGAFADITQIAADADTEACDVEVLMITA